MTAPLKYWAFISYSHQDKAWGDWLHRRLETYRVPRRLVGQPHWSGAIPRRLYPIFRDRDELPSSADLGGVLNEALRQSRYQIVICSPRAAQSRWVNEEIKFFKAHGREGRLLAFIVDGEPRVGSERECFPPELRVKADGQRTEIVAADAREGRDGREAAFLKLVAGILGVSFDDLKQRERRRQLWRRVQLGAVGIATFAAVFGSWQWFERYKAAQALDAHIEKVYDLGRRELLDHHEARAAVYLNEAYRLGRDTPALRFMLGQAMQAIDPLEDIRIETGGPVRRPAFAPDSKSFITPTQLPSGETVAQIWDTATGKQLAVLKRLPKSPLVTKFFPDGKHVLVSGFMEEQLDETRGTGAFTGIWDATTGERIARFDGHVGWFGQPTDNGGRWIVTADTGQPGAAVWNTTNATIAQRLNPGPQLLAASISPDGAHVLTGDVQGNTLLWDRATGRQLTRLPGQVTGHVAGLLFSIDGRRALAFGARGDVRIWNVDTGELQLSFAADSAGFNDVVLDDRNGRLITVGTEGYKVWDIDRGLLKFSRPADLINWATAALSVDAAILVTADAASSSAALLHLASHGTLITLERAGVIQAAAFSLDRKHLMLAHGNGTVELWRMPIRLERQFVHPQQSGKFASLYAAHFNHDESGVLTASYDGSLRLWNASDGSEMAHADAASPLEDAAYSPDGEHLASLTLDGKLRLHDARTLATLSTQELDPVWAADPLAFSPDSSVLAALPDAIKPLRQEIVLWRTSDGQRSGSFALGCLPSALLFVRAHPLVATGCLDGTLQQWDRDGGRRQRSAAGGDRVWQITESTAREIYATATLNDPEIRLWRIASGEQASSWRLPAPQFAEAIGFDRSGRLLAAGSSSGEVSVLDLDAGATRSLGSHTKEVRALRFLDNGLLLTWRADNAAKLWDPLRGELLGNVALHDELVWGGEMDRVGERLLTAGYDGIASIWDMRTEGSSAAEIARRLRCRSPWQLQGEALAPVGSTPNGCQSELHS